MDGNSPPPVRQSLEERVTSNGIRLIRRDQFLSPNVARNLAALQVNTKYVAFIDNDVIITPNWLNCLVACAEETWAWAVGPLYCQGEPVGSTIHMAGDTAHFYEHEGRRHFREAHTLCGQPVNKHFRALQRGPVELLEYHCLLLRTEVFDRFGPLDEQYLSLHEHVDLCLTLRQAGHGVFMEPQSLITYVGPLPLTASDRDFFSLRWCDAWNQLSIERFQRKWEVCPTDPGLVQVLDWATQHRCKSQTSWHSLLRPLGRSRARRLITACEPRFSRSRFPRELCQVGGPLSGGRTGRLQPKQRADMSRLRPAA